MFSSGRDDDTTGSSKTTPKATATTTNPSSSGDPRYITEIKYTDILCGRGHKIIQHPGNRNFRELVRTRKAEYVKTGRYKVKDQIARQLVDEIATQRGRFLRKVASPQEAMEIGVPDGVEAWVIAEEAVALEKTKQALRDKDPVKSSRTSTAESETINAPGLTESSELRDERLAAMSNRGAGSLGDMLLREGTNQRETQLLNDQLLHIHHLQQRQQLLQHQQRPSLTGGLASILLQGSTQQQPLLSRDLLYLQYMQQQDIALRQQQQQQQRIGLANLYGSTPNQPAGATLSVDNAFELQRLQRMSSQEWMQQQEPRRPQSLSHPSNHLFLGGASPLQLTSSGFPSLQGNLLQMSPSLLLQNVNRAVMTSQQVQNVHPFMRPQDLGMPTRLAPTIHNDDNPTGFDEDRKRSADDLKEDDAKIMPESIGDEVESTEVSSELRKKQRMDNP